jgi:hypothetical protein
MPSAPRVVTVVIGAGHERGHQGVRISLAFSYVGRSEIPVHDSATLRWRKL